MSNKENIEPKNSNGQLHGLCIYYSNGNVSYKLRYVNEILHGISEWYLDNGELAFKRYYINGKRVYSEYYGFLNRIEFWI